MAERGKIFKEAPILAPSRSWFDLSADHTLSMNFGEIKPVTMMECLPGDILKVKAGCMARLSPMISPVMGKVNLFSYWFYVRNRDIWTDFDKFITNNDQSKTWQQQSQFVAPQMPRLKPLMNLYDPALNGDMKPTISVPETEADGGVLLKWSDFKTCTQFYALRLTLPYTDGGITIWREPKVYAGTAVKKYVDPEDVDSFAEFEDGASLAAGIPVYSNTLLIVFKPNKSDILDYDTSNHRMLINPFGIGEFFNSTGFNMDGVYAKQVNNFFTKAFTRQGIVDDYSEPWYDNFMAFYDSPEETGFDLKEFMRTHYVACIAINYNGYSNNPADNIPGVGTVTGYCNCSDNGQVPTEDTWQSNTSVWSDAQLDQSISELPLRAYRFIYDEYFRDQNYIPVNSQTDFALNGLHAPSGDTYEERRDWFNYLTLETKAWEHDPYTSALPGPQRGDAVRFLSDAHLIGSDYTISGVSPSNGAVQLDKDLSRVSATMTGNDYSYTNRREILVDLSSATVENFRWANSMQKYLEKKARTGGRYYEYLLGIWNQIVPDAKLNRPIYLDGQKVPVQISEVLQTGASEQDTDQPLGQLAGRGISTGSDGYIEYEAPDYGFLVQVVAIVPRVSYQSGCAPMYRRMVYLDYPLPDFAKLGEQYVPQSELWWSNDPDEDDKPFGYQSRYYDWKYRRDSVSGEMCSNLDFWTFARKFDTTPIMGKDFIECKPDYRQFAFTSQHADHVQAIFFNDIQVNRALPEFGIPTL